jgi:hypothetical protein
LLSLPEIFEQILNIKYQVVKLTIAATKKLIGGGEKIVLSFVMFKHGGSFSVVTEAVQNAWHDSKFLILR